jgi:hypothetical protein
MGVGEAERTIMAIYKLTKDALTALTETKLETEGILERKDLQRLLRSQIKALDADLMVISEEFGDWVESNRRIDLLCLDKNANLVIVELKRTEDGGHMELQAIRYAAMVSKMTFPQLLSAYDSHLKQLGESTEDAQDRILQFLGWDEPQEDKFAQDVRIILASPNFSKELTTSVMWLNDFDVDIRCVRLKPYRDADGLVLLDIQQIIPLPEAAQYQTQIKAKDQAARAERGERHDLRYNFWSGLLEYAKTKTNLHANRKPGIYHWIGGSIGRAGFQLNYSVRGEESQVELYIDLGQNSDERNKVYFDGLKKNQAQIEGIFGGQLDWQDLPESRACRIRKVIEGGYRSPESEWSSIYEKMVDAMIRLDKALRGYVQNLQP